MSPEDPRHGTTAGYNAHRYDGEKACDRCKAAAAAYFARRELAMLRGESYTVSARGSIRRIHALVAIGWSMEHQAERLGINKRVIQGFAAKSPETRTRVATAKRYADLYDELHMTPGPSQRARLIAKRKGWMPPLAWDDIDDPGEQPNLRGRPICQIAGCRHPSHSLNLCRSHYDTRNTPLKIGA